METSWYGLFDLSPDDTLEVRAVTYRSSCASR